MSNQSIIGYVMSSGVRSEVLRAIERGVTDTDAILEDADASESAVYNALSALERRGLVASEADGWRLTGSGQVVADTLVVNRRVCDLLDDEYWETHDASRLPRELRRRIATLSDAEVVRADDTRPYQIVDEIASRVRDAERVDVISPIYQPTFADAMPDSERARLILGEAVVEQALEDVDDPSEAQQYEQTEVRVMDVDVAFAVTEDALLLSLPTMDGSYDSRTEVVAEYDRAVDWGRDLFDHYWDRATPAEEFLADYFR